jgi:hypothetical protein
MVQLAASAKIRSSPPFVIRRMHALQAEKVERVSLDRRKSVGSEEMASSYTGIFKIGDKAAGSVTHVQVVEEPTPSCWPMAVADYVGRGFLPRHDDLPWQQDWSSQSRPADADDLRQLALNGKTPVIILHGNPG